jgi:hypothetical protein
LATPIRCVICTGAIVLRGADLRIDSAALSGASSSHAFGNTIDGFASGDVIDLAFATGASATYVSSGGELKSSNGFSVSLQPGDIDSVGPFTVASNGHGGIDVYSSPHSTADPLHGSFG